MICPHCKSELPVGLIVCYRCGYPLKTAPQAQQTLQTPQVQQISQINQSAPIYQATQEPSQYQPKQSTSTLQPYRSTQPYQASHKKKNNSMPIIISVIIIVLLLCGAAGGHFLGLYDIPFLPEAHRISNSDTPDDHDMSQVVPAPMPVATPSPTPQPTPTPQSPDEDEDEDDKSTQQEDISELKRPFFGINTFHIDRELAQIYNMAEGAYIDNVHPGSAAEKAGLMSGDIIMAVGSAIVNGNNPLSNAMVDQNAGDTAILSIWRYSGNVLVTITFDEAPEHPTPSTQNHPSSIPPGFYISNKDVETGHQPDYYPKLEILGGNRYRFIENYYEGMAEFEGTYEVTEDYLICHVPTNLINFTNSSVLIFFLNGLDFIFVNDIGISMTQPGDIFSRG